ncbi:SusC/RagA family TonB-linked outer membrane protein [Zhouia sp. PK063]|uniref:SusC/RagA family TonB-linked outer membrane protein n=1 Tax=Zhouia sp. PK063 TaxID=3373602 RepID=UPI0037AD8307
MKFILNSVGCRYCYVLLVLLYILCPNAAHTQTIQQQFKISGTVSDAHGPLAGVTVRVSGSRALGTFTNFDGEFSLSVTASDTLVCSFIGYQTLKVPVGKQRQLSITLVEDVTALSEVTVNAGYYTVTERERTGSIAKVTAKEIENQPIVSPLEALQGRMAGVEVIQQSGVPGNAPVIRIRGQNSLRNTTEDNGNLPLYIVDGIPINSAPIDVGIVLQNGLDPLGTLNVADIESIEVLKDADATAIYGSRGANGVVLITTKKYKGQQKTSVALQWYSGYSEVSRAMKLLNTTQYITMREGALQAANSTPNEQNDWDLLVWDRKRYTNWQKVLLGGKAHFTNAHLTIAGGNAQTGFRVYGGWQEQGNVFPGDMQYRKGSAGLFLNHHSLDDRFSMEVALNFGADKNELYDSSALVMAALTLPPNAPKLYNDDGSLYWEEWTIAGRENPMAAQYATTTNKVQQYTAHAGLHYRLTPQLQITTNLGYNHFLRQANAQVLQETVAPEKRTDTPLRASQAYTTRASWIVEPQLNYKQNIGTHSTVEALIGGTFQENTSANLTVSAEGFSTPTLLEYLPAASVLTAGNNKATAYKYTAVYGRVAYQYEHTYFINLTGRRDGSSRFGPGKRFANFWAIGGAWIFSKEPWLAKASWLSFGKLRASYGITGNDQIGDYQYLDAFESTKGEGGLYPTQLFNADFSWEENKKLEGALQLGLLKDRINIEVSWYRNRSSNQLVGYPLPSTTGFSSVQANLPATVQNTGWEMVFSAKNISKGPLKWETFFNLTLPKTKLIAFPDIEQTSYQNIYKVGYPLQIGFYYRYTGVNPDTGWYQVADSNKDGSLDDQDRTEVLQTGKTLYGGIGSKWSYKGWSLQWLIDGVKQKGVKPYPYFVSVPGNTFNRPLADYNAWQQGNLHVERTTDFDKAYSAWRNSNTAVVDASFLRVKSVNLSYTLPQKWLLAYGISSCSVFANAQNLWTISRYEGINIDVPGSTNLPVLRSMSIGVQCNF